MQLSLSPRENLEATQKQEVAQPYYLILPKVI